jgi:predicted ATPase
VLRLKSEAGEDFSAAEVSDGTLKWLAILAALSTQQATVFVLEEPENFLHPWMQHALLRLARSQALSRGGAFIITTHSTSLLSACQPTEVITVESFGGNTRVRRLRSLREVQRLMTTAAMSLGDLWVDGSLGAVPNG